MRLSFILFVFSSLLSLGCTVYQSSGREDIEKNSGGVSTFTRGFFKNQSILYRCFASADLPTEALGSAQIIETTEEKRGLSSLLLDNPNKALVLHTSQSSSDVYYCEFESLDPISPSQMKDLARFAGDTIYAHAPGLGLDI